MPFQFTCPECRHTSQVFDHLAGTQAKCPSCGSIVAIPDPNPQPVVVYPVDDTVAEPAVPARKSGSGLLPILLAVCGLLLLFCCAGGGVGGFFLFRSVDKAGLQVVEATSKSTIAPTAAESSTPASQPEEQLPPDEDTKPASYWVQVLKDGNPDRVERARTRLVQSGALAVPELRKIIRDPDPAVRLAVLGILAQIGDLAFEAVGDVSAALNDREAAVRVSAARTLAQLGKPGRAALPALVAARADSHPQVQEAVAEALRRFSPVTKADLPKLAALLKDGTPEQRSANIAALRSLKPDADTTFALFGPLLTDPNKKIRIEALAAFAEGGKPARAQTLAGLFSMLDDADPDVRRAPAGGCRLADASSRAARQGSRVAPLLR